MFTQISPRDRILDDYKCQYNDTVIDRPHFPSLREDKTTEICIIGGGFTGFSAAKKLLSEKKEVILIERHKVGWGGSGRNGGQIIPGFNRGLDYISKKYGEETARESFQATLEALHSIKSFIKEEKIECDYNEGLILAAEETPAFLGLKKYADYKESHFKYDYSVLEKDEVSYELGSHRYSGGLKDMHCASFNPLKYLLSLSRYLAKAGLSIYEESPALSIEEVANKKYKIRTPSGTILADKIIVAGNAYLGDLIPEIRRKYIITRTSIIATAPLDKEMNERILPNRYAVCSWKNLLHYYRKTEENQLLFGGVGPVLYASKRQEKKIFERLQRDMCELYPELKKTYLSHMWGGYVCLTKDKMPYISKVPDTEIYYALGYAGHGIVPSHMAGEILSYLVTKPDLVPKFVHSIRADSIPFAGKIDPLISRVAINWYRLKDILGY